MRTASVGLHDIPPPFDALHTELVEGTDAILAAVAKLAGAGVAPAAVAAANGQARLRGAVPRRRHSDADDLNTKMLRAVEYMEFHAKHGEGTIRIHASNTEHSNELKKPHKIGTPIEEEWSDDIFLAVIEPAWTELLSLLCLFGGWRQENVILGRCTGDYAHLGKQFRRAVDTGSGVGHADWCAFSALLHIRNWQNFRDIDDGYVDLYFSADSDPHGWGSSPLENDPKVKQVLEWLLPHVKASVERIVRLILQDDSVVLGTRPPAWEPDTTPVNGGDAYHFRFVAV